MISSTDIKRKLIEQKASVMMAVLYVYIMTDIDLLKVGNC